MADLADELAVRVHFPHQLQNLRKPPELVRSPAAGNEDTIVVLCLHIVEGELHLAGNTIFAVIFSGLFRHQVHLGAGFPQPHHRAPEFQVFKVVTD